MNYLDDNAVVDAAEVVEAHWPYDGPHFPELTTTAAAAIDRLVRYLNNATGKPDAMPYVAVAGTLLASLHAAVTGTEQLAVQLARFAELQAADPTLYDDRRDRPGADTALALATELNELRSKVADLAGALDRAAELASHLGNTEPGVPTAPDGDGEELR